MARSTFNLKGPQCIQQPGHPATWVRTMYIQSQSLYVSTTDSTTDEHCHQPTPEHLVLLVEYLVSVVLRVRVLRSIQDSSRRPLRLSRVSGMGERPSHRASVPVTSDGTPALSDSECHWARGPQWRAAPGAGEHESGRRQGPAGGPRRGARTGLSWILPATEIPHLRYGRNSGQVDAAAEPKAPARDGPAAVADGRPARRSADLPRRRRVVCGAADFRGKGVETCLGCTPTFLKFSL